LVDYEELRAKGKKQAEKAWDTPAIEARFKKLTGEGIPKKRLNREEIAVNREEILKRVQLRGEKYEFMSRSCAKGAALAVMEEFGLGNMEIIKALSPFPGLSLTGRICGALSGGLVALGLYFGSDDLLDYQANRAAMTAARKLLERFEEKLGSLQCEDIQALVLSRYTNPWADSTAFKEAKGYEKCSLVAGIGARLAAEIIIESMSGL
jgi:C_GCAxxG_C_C family probable redox protein